MAKELIEYRVRPVTRYVVTKYENLDTVEREGGNRQAGSVGTCGEFDNESTAYNVAYALCKADHLRLGWPMDDPRIQYPKDLEMAGLESVKIEIGE